MFERLATTVTGLSQRVDRITVQEFVDCSRRHGAGDARRPHGHGQAARGDLHRVADVPRGVACSTSRRSPPPPTRSGCASTRSATRSGPRVVDRRRRGRVRARCRRARWSVRSCRGARTTTAGRPWSPRSTGPAPTSPSGTSTIDGGFLVRVLLEGAPNITVELRIGRDADPRARRRLRRPSRRRDDRGSGHPVRARRAHPGSWCPRSSAPTGGRRPDPRAANPTSNHSAGGRSGTEGRDPRDRRRTVRLVGVPGLGAGHRRRVRHRPRRLVPPLRLEGSDRRRARRALPGRARRCGRDRRSRISRRPTRGRFAERIAGLGRASPSAPSAIAPRYC